ncbi:hypothetical protein GCM10027403_34310 [Arthrobacter tecti]
MAGAATGTDSSGSTSAIALSVAGTLLCALPAALVGMALGYYPSRMVCTPETGGGSGCYEGELLYAGIFFLALFTPFALGSYTLTKGHRRHTSQIVKWWPFGQLVGVTLTIVGIYTTSGLLNPNEYF